MEVLGDARTSLRSFLLEAVATCPHEVDRVERESAIRSVRCPELKRLLHETVVYHYYKASSPYPRLPWSSVQSLQLSEVIALVIERLLTRRRADPSDSNLLTLGYREVAPGSHGHRVTASNSVMCYFPNTLVATLKTAVWEALHALIGDDLLVHLLLNYCIFVKVPHPSGSYIQVAGNSLRWMKRPLQEPTHAPDNQHQSKKRKKMYDAKPHSVAPASEISSSTVSINHVMYARHFKKRKIFAKSELAAASSSGGDSVSRGQASKLICSVFPDAKNEKRLPKRLLNLVPIAQELLQRVQTTDIDGIVSRLLPTPPKLTEFLRDHRDVRDVLFANASRAGSSGGASPSLDPLVVRIDEEGYHSQAESPGSRESRKRKRREVAVAALSTNSAAVAVERKAVRKVRFEQEDAGKLDVVESPMCVAQLTHLQRHRDEIAHLLQIKVPKRRVRRVVRKVLAAILPKSLFGKPLTDLRKQDSNWSKMKLFIDRLISSRKYDILCIDRVANGFGVKEVGWMNASGKSICPPNELLARRKLMSQVLQWVIRNIVFPILRNCFYITESEGSANEVFYYSRPVWTIISNLALYDLSASILKPTTTTETALVSSELGVSRLRLLPKISGVRPLMNLSGKSLDMDVSVNRSLELVHRALLFEIDRQSDRLLGSTVRNVDEIHAKLTNLTSRIQACPRCAHVEGRKLYCVTVDVERCFDTIRPKKLLRVLKKVFAEEEYLVRKHWVCKGAYYKMERPAFPSGDLKGYDQLVQDIAKKKDAVFVDGVLYDYISKAKILTLLREHLTANTVQANDQLYTQRQGIPQGSVLSTTLCNLYYAHFEKRVLQKQMQAMVSSQTEIVDCSHELIMRYTDDYLFVSTDQEKAREFAQLMHRGNHDYGCFVNLKKSRVNFPVLIVDADGEMREIPRVDQPSDADATTRLLAWCGLLLDPDSLQVYANYDKLSLNVVAASVPVDDTKNIGAVFVNKVISAVRQRWHRLYFDPNMLYRSTIQVNVYQLLCLAALRFVLLVDKLPTSSSTYFLYDCVRKILMKTSRGIQRTLLEGTKQQQDEVDGLVWHVGLHSFSVMISGTKLPCDASTKRARAKTLPLSTSHALWESLLKQIRQDQKRLLTSETKSVTTSQISSNKHNLLTLNELERDPRNVVVDRWLAAYTCTAR